MTPVELLSIGATLALNAGFAWLTGSLLSRIWLGRAHPQLLGQCARRLKLGEMLAGVLCLGASVVSIWAASALMGDVPLADALAMLPKVLLQTSYGQTALCAIAVLLLLLLALATPSYLAVRGALLGLFALARAMMSHAGEHGLLSVAVGIEGLHLILIGVWLGVVALSAWVVLPNARGPLGPYLGLVSRAATVALAGIVASGAFNTWQRLESPAQLLSTSYGMALSAKLILFGLAVLLGAYNRYVGFPRLARAGLSHAVPVLRIESLVLLGALAAAAVLTSQAPPL